MAKGGDHLREKEKGKREKGKGKREKGEGRRAKGEGKREREKERERRERRIEVVGALHVETVALGSRVHLSTPRLRWARSCRDNLEP
jgi:hypothetical protein